MLFEKFVVTLVSEAMRAITGRMFTDQQIRTVSAHTVGKYLADWLPESSQERTARERVNNALDHIQQASAIISAMQAELGAQTKQLDLLLVEVEEKKKLADQYTQLAATKKEQFSALRSEMEAALRAELVAQSEKGKRVRQFGSFVFWIINLLIGAALGIYFPQIVNWAKTIIF